MACWLCTLSCGLQTTKSERLRQQQQFLSSVWDAAAASNQQH